MNFFFVMRNMLHAIVATLILPALLSSPAQAQKTGAAPLEDLPSSGLSQHPFLYCGEWQNQSLDRQTMYLVRDGKVAWSYTNPKEGELGDCTRLSNGNIVFSRQFGASEIDAKGSLLWNYDGPAGTEIHTAYPMGNDRVMVVLNGAPAHLLVLRKLDNRVETDLLLPTKKPSTHGQFRRARPTATGTFLVAHMDLGKIIEYSNEGKPIWSVDAPGAWSAIRLKNGNTLIGGNSFGYVREVDPAGKIVWEVDRNDLPGIAFNTVQEVSRLANGNTLINNWTAGLPRELWKMTVQLVEVTPQKKVVWALSDWKVLGPASATQLLDEPGIPENGELQR